MPHSISPLSITSAGSAGASGALDGTASGLEQSGDLGIGAGMTLGGAVGEHDADRRGPG